MTIKAMLILTLPIILTVPAFGQTIYKCPPSKLGEPPVIQGMPCSPTDGGEIKKRIEEQQPSLSTPIQSVESPEKHKSDQLIIKGFYMGMPRQEAIERFKKLVDTREYTFKKDEIKYIDKKNRSSFTINIDINSNNYVAAKFSSSLKFENDELVALYLNSHHVNEIFNASHVDMDDFVVAFAKAHNIEFNDKGIADDNDGIKRAFYTFKDTNQLILIQIRCNIKQPSHKDIIFKSIPKPEKMNFQ